MQETYSKSLAGGGFAQLNAEALSCAQKFAREMVGYFLAETDRLLREEPERKERYRVERNGQVRIMQTEYGELKIERTLYQDKSDGSYHCLVDELLGIDKYERLEDNLKAKVLLAASDTSYGKAGKVSGGSVSRQTVMNVVHRLKEIKAVPERKSGANTVYIEADEDHIHMQDGKSSILKLIYVHEGVEAVSKGRNKLLNPWYFTSIEKDSDNLWYEVMDYVESVYDTENVKLTLRGDGGWIKGGLGYFPKAKFELDSFHMFKSITRATGHYKKLRGLIIDSIQHKEKRLRAYSTVLRTALRRGTERKRQEGNNGLNEIHSQSLRRYCRLSRRRGLQRGGARFAYAVGPLVKPADGLEQARSIQDSRTSCFHA